MSKNMSHDQIHEHPYRRPVARNHPDFIRPITRCANTNCQHTAAAHARVDAMHHYRGECANCNCEAFVKVPTIEQMNQRMTPQEERDYFDEVAQYGEPPVTEDGIEDAPYDHARPDYRAKHMKHLAHLFALEANFIVNVAMNISQSEWDNHLDWRYAVKNLEGRCHSWQCLVSTVGYGIAERTLNFDVTRWREACSWDKVNMIYTGVLKDIREFDKGGN